MTVRGWPEVFRGTAAIAAGLVTPGQLRGPAFERLLPDTYVPAPEGMADLRLRSLAASLWAGDDAVLFGYSAAEMHRRSCAPLGAPAEVAVPATCPGPRSRREVHVHRDVLHPRDVVEVAGVRVTGPARTAFDLARRLPTVEGVVAIDALARGSFAPDLLLTYAARHPGLRGVRKVLDALCLADARSGSPPETRLRLLLVLGGLPRPAVQHPVLDDRRRRAVWLDLAYPEHRLGIEYDGGEHFATPQAVRADVQRHTALAAAGWRVLRYTAAEMRNDPQRIVAEVRHALGDSRRDAAQRRPVIDNSR